MSKTEAEALARIINILVDWSGVESDSPDETEIVASQNGMEVVTLGDLKDASHIVQNHLAAQCLKKNLV